jgi:hypothetical protein
VNNKQFDQPCSALESRRGSFLGNFIRCEGSQVLECCGISGFGIIMKINRHTLNRIVRIIYPELVTNNNRN